MTTNLFSALICNDIAYNVVEVSILNAYDCQQMTSGFISITPIYLFPIYCASASTRPHYIYDVYDTPLLACS
jgi:hypothetical protein